MKKLTAIFLAVITVASLGVFSMAGWGIASAATESTEEPEPDEYGVYVCNNLEYYVLEDGTAEIKNCTAFDSVYTTVDIPETVYGRTVSGLLGVFYFNQLLSSVTIPNTVKYLKYDTFACCYNLESIDIPDSVEFIGHQVFWNCTSLETLNIGSGLKTIEDGAFRDEKGLGLKEINVDPDNQYFSSEDGVLYNKDKTVLIKYPTANERQVFEIPEGVEVIYDEAFLNCKSIRKVVFPSTLKTINNRAFENTVNLEEIVINEGLQKIEDAFGKSGLRTLRLPESVTEIESLATTKLRYIAIPEGVVEMPSVFDCEYLVSMYIPASVAEFSHQVFDYADSLTEIYYGGTIEEFKSIIRCDCDNSSDPELCPDPEDFATIDYNHTHTLDRYYVVKAASPDSKGVADHACVCGYSVREEYEYEPNSKIEGFCGYDLTWNFDFETGALLINGEGKMFDYCDVTDLPWYGIKDKIKSVKFGDAVTSITDYAFADCSEIKEFTLGEGMVTLGKHSLSGCSGIEKLALPENVTTTLGTVIFDGCSGVKELYVGKNVDPSDLRYFRDFTGLEKLTLSPDLPHYYVDDSGVLYGTGAMYLYFVPPCSPTENYIIPETVEYIWYAAFQNNKNLKTIYVTNNLKAVNQSAFANCTGLTDIYFSGTEAELNAIKIRDDNDILYEATYHFEHVHSFASVTDSKDATCTEDGYIKYTDCECGLAKTEVVPKKGHSGGEWVYKSDRIEVKTCSVCGEEYKKHMVSFRMDSYLEMLNGEKVQLDFAITATYADRLKFTSSDESVVVFNEETGIISAKKAGEAIITAAVEGTDMVKTCTVIVVPGCFYVTWDVDGEKTVDEVWENEPIPVPDDPEKEGMIFVGWTPEIPEVMPAEELVFTAVFNKISKAENYDVSAIYSTDCFNEEITLDVAEISGDREPGGVYMVEGEYYEQIGLYNIKAVNADSEVVQPNEGCKVKIKIALPEEYKSRTSFIIYHRFVDGGREQLSTENGTLTVENGYLIFEVSSFSEFEIYASASYIKVITPPTKTVYKYGEELDLTGIKIGYTSGSGTTKTVTDPSKLTVKGYNSKETGRQTVTVNYGQHSDTFEIEVRLTFWQWILRIFSFGLLFG